jgi:hypothetical protein
MDRHVVACYDAEIGGHFTRHRDYLNPDLEHRRFAVSINLNGNYDGCDLIFPEFGDERIARLWAERLSFPAERCTR